MNVAIITLGCTKNEVDSEMIVGYLLKKNYRITTNLNDADIIIINTCGFIELARKEAIEVILDASDYKMVNCKHLIVVGCMAKLYKQEILKEFKEVDLVIGVDEYDRFDEIFSEYFDTEIDNYGLDFNDRIVSTKFPIAYVRISDGCNNKCSYCAIPYIRGAFKSRKMEDILNEVKNLVSQGFTDFNLISQDTTKYGLDIYNEYKLKDLLFEISKIDGVRKIRILYMYLHEVT